jgi:deoxycytidine triphosphate deaminase
MDNISRAGILNSSEIIEGIASGRILCVPFNNSNLGEASLGLTLGYYFYKVENGDENPIYNPIDRDEAEKYFDGPYKALRHNQWTKSNRTLALTGINSEHPVISLKPSEHILAHSHEFISIKPPGIIDIRPNPNWVHNGLAIDCYAQLSNNGNAERLVFSIYNLNHYKTIVIPVGEQIGQVFFYNTNKLAEGYDSEDQLRHHKIIDIETIIQTWSPDMMLPTLYLEKRDLPIKLEGTSYE